MGPSLSQTTNSFIITCDCADTPTFAKEAANILGLEYSQVILKKDLPVFAQKYEGTDFGAYLNSLIKNVDKFAYYFGIADGGEIVSLYDLQKGVKVA